MRLSNELYDGTYKPKKPRHFIVTAPKLRSIASIAFRDRVYQRSLNDNVVYPFVTSSFIYDNYACQKGKGTDAARNRMKEFLQKAYRHHQTNFYVLQVDIKGYYPNMSHEKTEKMFKSRLDSWTYARVEEILRGQYEGENGYNPGSQLVQIAGIAMLDGLDHYIKEQLHIKYYIRYMDDFILMHEDKEFLKGCKEKIAEYLQELKFEVNSKKTKIYPISHGIEFLGFKFTLTDTGKVLMQIRPENVKRQRKKLFRLVHKCLRGELPRPSVDESYRAWRTHASKGNNYKLIQRMDRYYKSLWIKENKNDFCKTQDSDSSTGG